jgi:hypothetical protein
MLMIVFYLLSLLVAYTVFSLDCWRQLDEPAQNEQSRDRTIDGMRGFLALSVVLFHSVMTRGLLETGEWEISEGSIFFTIGQRCGKSVLHDDWLSLLGESGQE